MQEIAASSEEQAIAARNMADAMRTISTIAMETSTGARQTAAVVEVNRQSVSEVEHRRFAVQDRREFDDSNSAQRCCVAGVTFQR
jgi:methyl-accepting chemotaxis protein